MFESLALCQASLPPFPSSLPSQTTPRTLYLYPLRYRSQLLREHDLNVRKKKTKLKKRIDQLRSYIVNFFNFCWPSLLFILTERPILITLRSILSPWSFPSEVISTNTLVHLEGFFPHYAHVVINFSNDPRFLPIAHAQTETPAGFWIAHTITLFILFWHLLWPLEWKKAWHKLERRYQNICSLWKNGYLCVQLS